MDDSHFWTMIEIAWNDVGGQLSLRQRLAGGKLSQEMAEVLLGSLADVISALRNQLEKLSAADLLTFDRILESKLYAIDRAEIHKYTDGSDDGFLYARGFIVAIGKEYYDAVNAQPSRALIDLECEEICYLPCFIYEEKFGEIPLSDTSRESCANTAGWPHRR